MKKVVIVMAAMFALMVWPFGGVWQLLAGILGGGVQQSFLYPLYGGIILLAGLVVACTELVLEEIRELKAEKKEESKE